MRRAERPVQEQVPTYREPWRPPPPSRPRLLGLALGALLFASLAAFTTNKLVTMAHLRGDLAGIPERTMILSGERRRLSKDTITFGLVDPRSPGGPTWELQLRPGQSEKLRFGDEIVVRCVDIDRSCYVPGSVYIDDGNRRFDLGLLGFELIGLGACVLVATGRLRAWRRALRGIGGRRATPPAPLPAPRPGGVAPR
jgi:hypothetical protein